MDNLVVIAGIVIGIGLISVLLGSFLTFDQLIRLEYNSYKSQWENDGKPRGFFWVPPEYWRSYNTSWFNTWKSRYKIDWAFYKKNLIWLFSTPQWIKNDEKAKNLIRQLRTLVLIWNSGVVLGFISIFLVIGIMR